MANYDQISKWRVEGMYYAYEKIKENGIDEFAKELEVRQKFGARVLTSKGDYRKQVDEIVNQSAKVTITFCLAVLFDEFDFDTDMCQRFMDRFNIKTACLVGDYLTWDDHMKMINEEIGVRVGFED